MPPEKERSWRRIVPGAWVRCRPGMNTHMYDSPTLGWDHDAAEEQLNPFTSGIVIARLERVRHRKDVTQRDPAILVMDSKRFKLGWCYISALASLAT